MTAKTQAQTRQPRRGLTFEDVWAAMMETERQLNELKYGLDMDRDDPPAIRSK
jgi:hypothetical protein